MGLKLSAMIFREKSRAHSCYLRKSLGCWCAIARADLGVSALSLVADATHPNSEADAPAQGLSVWYATTLMTPPCN